VFPQKPQSSSDVHFATPPSVRVYYPIYKRAKFYYFWLSGLNGVTEMADITSAQGYLRIWDKKTGEQKGYIAADAVQNAWVIANKDDPNHYICVCNFTWGPIFGSVWLNSSNAAFQQRQLGVGTGNVADWGIPSPGGWRNPLFYHEDTKTIELADQKGRFLVLGDGNYLYWSGGPDDPNIVCGEIVGVS
jgi:hypothetical protein